MTFFATASGFTIDKVRSTAILIKLQIKIEKIPINESAFHFIMEDYQISGRFRLLFNHLHRLLLRYRFDGNITNQIVSCHQQNNHFRFPRFDKLVLEILLARHVPVIEP